MKRNRYIGIMILSAIVAMMVSCSDFKDYNEAYTNETASSKLTLWENISNNGNLKNFAALIKKAGFDDELQSSHFYTVWAPVDGTYNYDSLSVLDSSVILSRFVESHIADYNYGVSGNVDNEYVFTLNRKAFIFGGSGDSYTFDDKNVLLLNQPSVNGVFHTISGAAEFHPNIYEYIFDSQGTDSLQNYFLHFQNTYLDESRSVIGPTVNGHQTYIDSVMVTTNRLFSRLKANINVEDSNYTMMFPTNEAWSGAYSKIKKYFNYIAKTASYQYSALSTDFKSPTTLYKTIDMNYYADSLTKKSLVQNLVFNNNNIRNRWVTDSKEENTDTILTTTNELLSKASETLARTIKTVKTSNGYVRYIDSLSVHPWDSWCPDLSFAATNTNYRVKTTSATVSTVRISENDLDKDKAGELYSYADFVPASEKANPAVAFNLPNPLSTSYNIYCVFVPANIRKGSTATVKPYKVNFTLNYCDAKGAMQKMDYGIKYNDTTKLDTMFVGKITFPICYSNLGTAYSPTLLVTSKLDLIFGKDITKYDNELRIAAILLKPVEHEEYEDKLK